MASALKKMATKVSEQARCNAAYFERRQHLFAMVAVVGFPLYYIVWHDVFPQPYENLPLRLAGSAIFIPIIFARYWPARARKYLLWYWYGAVVFGLPFFFSFMTLKNSGSVVWAESALVAVFVMVLLLNWTMIIVHCVLGVGLAALAYYLTTDIPHLPPVALEHLAIVMFAIILGTISNYGMEMVRMEQERAMLATAASIAHELRTPLLGIRAGAAGLRDYLPALIEAYEMACGMDLPVKRVRVVHLNMMKGVLDRIDMEANYSNTIIDMLLTNVRKVDGTGLAACSMAGCVDAALDRYPFNETERGLVSWRKENDFVFLGSQLLMVHVLFNLFKNALRHIAKAGKGHIWIRLKDSPGGHSLIFLDTGSGVPPEAQMNIFRRFYSGLAADGSMLGSGIGLAFCREVMQVFGGDIECSSVFGKFTRFVLTFPGIHHE